LGRDPGPQERFGPAFLYVTEDPEAAWRQVAPYLLHNIAAYERWTREGYRRSFTPFAGIHDLAGLHSSPAFQVLTPDECVAFAHRLDPEAGLLFHPLMGGLPPQLSWPSLELFADTVLPKLSGVTPT
jgi:hypothetical protein